MLTTTTLHYKRFTAPWTSSGTTRVSRYQKGKTYLDLLEQEIVSGICKSAPRLRQITTPESHFYRPNSFLLPNQQHQSTEGCWQGRQNTAICQKALRYLYGSIVARFRCSGIFTGNCSFQKHLKSGQPNNKSIVRQHWVHCLEWCGISICFTIYEYSCVLYAGLISMDHTEHFVSELGNDLKLWYTSIIMSSALKTFLGSGVIFNLLAGIWGSKMGRLEIAVAHLGQKWVGQTLPGPVSTAAYDHCENRVRCKSIAAYFFGSRCRLAEFCASL